MEGGWLGLRRGWCSGGLEGEIGVRSGRGEEYEANWVVGSRGRQRGCGRHGLILRIIFINITAALDKMVYIFGN